MQLACLRHEKIDQIDNIQDPARGPLRMQERSMGVGKMCLPTSGAAVQHDVVLLREEERLNENTLMRRKRHRIVSTH